MKLSTKGRYGTRAMLNLALHHKEGSILLKNVAKQEEISEKYLEHLFSLLKQAGLVKSERGMHGGYQLARPPEQISLHQVLTALEGNFELAECIDNPRLCKRARFCATRDVWSKLKKNIQESFSAITLENLVKQQKQKSKFALMYNI